MSMKYIMLEGRLGRDAEIKTTARGNKFVTFSLAVDSFGKDGEKTTDWFNVSSFQENHTGKFAEYLKKGSGLIVMGTPTFSTWRDRDGNTRVDVNVRATNLEFPTLGGKKEDGGTNRTTGSSNRPKEYETQPVTRSQSSTYTQTSSYAPVTDEPEDDLPF